MVIIITNNLYYSWQCVAYFCAYNVYAFLCFIDPHSFLFLFLSRTRTRVHAHTHTHSYYFRSFILDVVLLKISFTQFIQLITGSFSRTNIELFCVDFLRLQTSAALANTFIENHFMLLILTLLIWISHISHILAPFINLLQCVWCLT